MWSFKKKGKQELVIDNDHFEMGVKWIRDNGPINDESTLEFVETLLKNFRHNKSFSESFIAGAKSEMYGT